MDGTGRRGATRKELHEEGRTPAKAPDGTWTNPSQDGERPPREEWPIAMKILTGTAALADRSRDSVFLLSFLFSLPFLSSLPFFSVRLLFFENDLPRPRVTSRVPLSKLLTYAR